ncbi:MAG: DAK2 domain-containing protein [Actinomycetota bacterium]|nr:DAK2 domain-containing protein [Actinomycetota bacterium]
MAAAVLAVAAALDSARTGVAETSALQVSFGRSSYLGTRAIGHPDPGAQAVVVWFEDILRVFEEGRRSACFDTDGAGQGDGNRWTDHTAPAP